MKAAGITTVSGSTAIVGGSIADGNLYINGVSIGAVTVQANDANNALVDAINKKQGETGVVASKDSQGKLTLTALDGRNIALAYPELRSVNNYAAVVQIVNRAVNERLEVDVGTRGEIPLERLEEVLDQIDQIGDEVQADIQERLSRR